MFQWRVKLAAALTAAGLLAGLTVPAWAAEASTVRQYETAQPVTSVVADVESAVLVIQKGTGSTVQVDSDADAKGEYTYDFDLKDGVLTVRVEAIQGEKIKTKGVPIHVGVIHVTVLGDAVICDNEITITLPEAVYDKIEGKTRNGSITASGVEAETLSLDAKNGDVTLENTRGVKVQAKTANGDIRLDHPYGLDYDLTSQNGDISGTLAGTKADYRLRVEARNGDSNLEDQAGTGVASANLKAQNGDVRVDFTG